LKLTLNVNRFPESVFALAMAISVVSDILREKKLAFYGLRAFFLDSEGGQDEPSSKKCQCFVRIATHAFLFA